jgi:hypothetical protein
MTSPLSRPIDGIPAWHLCARLLWVAVEIILVFWLGQKGVYFVYQGF